MELELQFRTLQRLKRFLVDAGKERIGHLGAYIAGQGMELSVRPVRFWLFPPVNEPGGVPALVLRQLSDLAQRRKLALIAVRSNPNYMGPLPMGLEALADEEALLTQYGDQPSPFRGSLLLSADYLRGHIWVGPPNRPAPFTVYRITGTQHRVIRVPPHDHGLLWTNLQGDLNKR